jgi:hypothetical protein
MKKETGGIKKNQKNTNNNPSKSSNTQKSSTYKLILIP